MSVNRRTIIGSEAFMVADAYAEAQRDGSRILIGPWLVSGFPQKRAALWWVRELLSVVAVFGGLFAFLSLLLMGVGR